VTIISRLIVLCWNYWVHESYDTALNDCLSLWFQCIDFNGKVGIIEALQWIL
jgi:hypothetical protein